MAGTGALGPIPEADGFVGDVRYAMRCWSADPRLPLVSLGLVVVGFIPSMLTAVNPALGILGLFVLPLSLFSIGFYGTQRIWYLRLFRGHTMGADEVWSMSWKMFGRYVALGLLTGWPVMILSFVYFAYLMTQLFANYRPGGHAPEMHLTLNVFLVLVILASLIWDFLLTFATPALAYTTHEATAAWRLGIRMIQTTWPACALYVFFPPLALQVLSGLPGAVGIRSLPLVYGATVVVSMVNLLAKGAVAAFYVRRVQVPDDGALNVGYVAPYGEAPYQARRDGWPS